MSERKGQALQCLRCGEHTADGKAHYRNAHGVESVPLDEWVKATAEGFPPLTPAQFDRLALLLRPNEEPFVASGDDVLAEMLEE